MENKEQVNTGRKRRRAGGKLREKTHKIQKKTYNDVLGI